MKGRIPWPGGGHAEVEATPEEFAALARLLSDGVPVRAGSAQGAHIPSPLPKPVPTTPPVTVAGPAPPAATPPAPASPASHPSRAAPAAGLVALSEREDPEALPDDVKVPEPAMVQDFLKGRPDFEHSIRDVFQHFGAGPISPTNPDGTMNPVHTRWMESINKARALIIQEKKGFFKTEWRGGEKVYVFWYAPFQDWAPAALVR